MDEPTPDNRPKSDKPKSVPIVNLLPNLVTITAICAGLTAIRFGYQGDFEMAVRLVLLAGVLDGIDGRLARLLRCSTPVGAELDSLADFLNFGVAPGLILHAWALQDVRGLGWIAVLGYVICCVLRLARFNVSNRMDTQEGDKNFFDGVPSPAGAVLAMLPLYVSFLNSGSLMAPPIVVAVYLFVIGLLMISHIPTYSFKNISIFHENAKFLILGVALIAAGLLTYLWATLVLMTIAYVLVLIWTLLTMRRSKA